jgi:hypothetical protein
MDSKYKKARMKKATEVIFKCSLDIQLASFDLELDREKEQRISRLLIQIIHLTKSEADYA